MTAKKKFACRACGCTGISVLLDLGQLPLANAFVKNENETDDQFTENLTLIMCGNCKLIQIRDEVPREKLYSSFLPESSASSRPSSSSRKMSWWR